MGLLARRRRPEVPPLLPLRLPSPLRSRPSPLSGISRPRRLRRPGQVGPGQRRSVRSDAPAFDDLATWTGSVIRHPDGTWFMFYTGATLTPAGNVQRIGFATSEDLMTWRKNPDNPVLQADPRWYEQLADGCGPTRPSATPGSSRIRTGTDGTCCSPPEPTMDPRTIGA